MRFKNEVDYACRILLYLTKNGKGRIISSTELATQEKIPHLFSLRILKKMEKAGLVNIQKGSKGGYSLRVDPKDITLQTAVECIEGKIELKECVRNPETCNVRQGNCPVCRAMENIENTFVSELSKYNFQELADQELSAKE